MKMFSMDVIILTFSKLWSKYLTLSILHSELMSIEGVERNLHLTREELSDLTCIHLKFYHLSQAENQGK